MAIDINFDMLNRSDIGKLLCCDLKSVDNYTKLEDPLPFHESTGKGAKYFVWREVLAWYARKQVKTITPKFKPQDELSEAKLAGQNLKNELDQLELDVRKGNLLEVEDVRREWSKALIDIKQSLLNVGHIAATDIVDGMKHSKKKKIIDTLIFQNLQSVIDKAKDTDEEG